MWCYRNYIWQGGGFSSVTFTLPFGLFFCAHYGPYPPTFVGRTPLTAQFPARFGGALFPAVYFLINFSRSAAICTKDGSSEADASRFLTPCGLKRS